MLRKESAVQARNASLQNFPMSRKTYQCDNTELYLFETTLLVMEKLWITVFNLSYALAQLKFCMHDEKKLLFFPR